MNQKIKALIKLQEQDIERIQATLKLEGLPREIEILEHKIDDIKKTERVLVQEIKELEVKRHVADVSLKDLEEKIIKFKNQQLEVKKPEEYEMLGKQIDQEKENIKVIEDEGIEILMVIDEKKDQFEAKKEEFAKRIGEIGDQINHLKKQGELLKGTIVTLESEIEELSKEVEPQLLKKYEQVKRQSKRGPYVAMLDPEQSRCLGCHLKVSGETVSLVRQGEQIVQCDNCARILYWPQ